MAVGYLSLALSITMLLVSVLTQYMASFVPMLALFDTRGQRGDAGAWLERLMRFSGVLIGVILIGMLLLTYPVAPRLFGADFGPVSRIFLLLGLPLLIQPLVWAGRYAATAFGQPRVAFIATMAGMLAALLASLLLIPTLGAIGAVLALAAGILLMGAALLLTSPWLRPPGRLAPHLRSPPGPASSPRPRPPPPPQPAVDCGDHSRLSTAALVIAGGDVGGGEEDGGGV